MSRISAFGKSNGVYMSLQQHLDAYENKEELKVFLRAQEIGRMASAPDGGYEKINALLIQEFGSVDAAIEKFETVTANITKHWQPEEERRDGSFEGLMRHAATKNGIDLRKLEAQEGRYGTNGGRGCDVSSGPCSCGAWH
jgi:hypothetical protein